LKFTSEMSESVFRSKYMLPNEVEPSEAVERIVNVVKKYFPYLENEVRQAITNKWIGIAGGLYRSAENPNKNVSVINCTTLGQIDDTLESIADGWYRWAKYAAYGQGEGIDVSNLRPNGAKVHNSSRASTGPVSFMYTYDAILSIIAQQGRRGASLISLNISHPDILEFIQVKAKSKGLKNPFGDEIFSTMNISVMITDDFMEAVEKNKDWVFTYQNKYETIKSSMSARDIFNIIATSAWESGDPGILFWDNASKYSNSNYLGYPIECTNACFTGDTIVATADGRNGVSIKQLANESQGINKISVYSSRPNKSTGNNGGGWKTEVKNAIAFKTGKRKIIEVTLSDGSSFKCTPDHLLALPDQSFVEAQNSLGKQIAKFYTFSDKNSNRNYRMVNTKSNGYNSQYRLIWEFNNGKLDTSKNSLHHIDENASNDLIENIQLLTKEEHDEITRESRINNNSINRMDPVYRRWLNRYKNIKANATRYNWTEERYNQALKKFIKENPKPEVNKENKNVYLDEDVYIVAITDKGMEDVYDLTVEDNHTFNIITKTDDDNFLNSSGILVHNCGEVPQDPDNVCMLSSINLAKFHEYGIEGFKRLTKLLIYVLDAFRRYEIDEDRSPTQEQKWKLIHLPRVGAGTTGWADYFIRKNIRYGSEESIQEVENLSYIMAEQSYIASYEIAKDVDGQSFSTYDKDKYMKSAFVKNLLKKGFDPKYLDYQAHVTKNAIAPTGTLSLIVEAGGSGIEPLFAKYYVRRERSTSGEWKEWFTFNDLVVQELSDRGLEVTKENADSLDPNIWVTAHDVDNLTKIDLVSMAQKYVDSAISVTYNLSKNASVEEVRDIYWAAWKNKLKGVTVYREGSKEGVLITDANYEESKSLTQITDKNRFSPSRPETVVCDIYQTKANGIPHIVLVGLVENEPYEIFATSNEDNIIKLGKYKQGFIQKQKKGHYTLIVENGEEKTIVDNLNETFNINYNSLSRFISMSLRHKVPIEFIVDQLAKDKNFVGFEKSVSRILKKYIKENEEVKTSETCPNCGSKQLVYKEGCKSCIQCSWSLCG